MCISTVQLRVYKIRAECLQDQGCTDICNLDEMEQNKRNIFSTQMMQKFWGLSRWNKNECLAHVTGSGLYMTKCTNQYSLPIRSYFLQRIHSSRHKYYWDLIHNCRYSSALASKFGYPYGFVVLITFRTFHCFAACCSDSPPDARHRSTYALLASTSSFINLLFEANRSKKVAR